VAEFLRRLRPETPGRLSVLLSNGKIHRGDPIKALLSRTARLRLNPFPPYAAELNPDEGVWNNIKKTLANGRPDNKVELMDILSEEICQMAASQTILRGCIKQSELPSFLP